MCSGRQSTIGEYFYRLRHFERHNTLGPRRRPLACAQPAKTVLKIGGCCLELWSRVDIFSRQAAAHLKTHSRTGARAQGGTPVVELKMSSLQRLLDAQAGGGSGRQQQHPRQHQQRQQRQRQQQHPRQHQQGSGGGGSGGSGGGGGSRREQQDKHYRQLRSEIERSARSTAAAAAARADGGPTATLDEAEEERHLRSWVGPLRGGAACTYFQDRERQCVEWSAPIGRGEK